MSETDKRLAELGIELPQPPISSPLAEYVTVKRKDDLLFLSGVWPSSNGSLWIKGRLVSDLKHETGYEAARIAGLNALSLIREALGSLDEVDEILKVVGYIASDDDFYDQHMILNGASHLFKDVFGDRGSHVCTPVGVNVLPFGVPVMLDIVVAVKRKG